MKKKKGFTLIELMIVIAIVAILAQVMIPKVGAVKVQMKNNSVETNAKLVRAFLENRASKDANSIKTYLANNVGDITGALSLVEGIESTAMNSNFTLSDKITNPFNQSASILADKALISSYGSTAAAIVVGYDATSELPVDEAYATANLPQGSVYMGEVVVVIYQTGYVVYGIDDQGNKVDINIIKMPNGLVVGNITTPGAGTTPVIPTTTASVLSNIDRVNSFLIGDGDSIGKIINAYGTANVYNALQDPLYNTLFAYFNSPSSTPTDSKYNAVVNPIISGYDQVIYNSGNLPSDSKNTTSKYSVISCQTPSLGTSDYSTYKGVTVVYPIITSPYGYDIYGIDQNGSKIGEKTITLNSMITTTMTNTLENNINSITAFLTARVANDKINCGNDFYNYVPNTFFNDIKNYGSTGSIKNAYVNTWNNVKYSNADSTFYSYGNVSVLVAINHSGYNLYKGSVIVNAVLGNNNTLDGYEVYGYDYNGVMVGYSKIH